MIFDVARWFADPGVTLLKPATRAVLVDFMCVMHMYGDSELSGSIEDLARLSRATPHEVKEALQDMEDRGVADIEFDGETITVKQV